jgi:hypothetical protein
MIFVAESRQSSLDLIFPEKSTFKKLSNFLNSAGYHLRLGAAITLSPILASTADGVMTLPPHFSCSNSFAPPCSCSLRSYHNRKACERRPKASFLPRDQIWARNLNHSICIQPGVTINLSLTWRSYALVTFQTSLTFSRLSRYLLTLLCHAYFTRTCVLHSPTVSRPKSGLSSTSHFTIAIKTGPPISLLTYMCTLSPF